MRFIFLESFLGSRLIRNLFSVLVAGAGRGRERVICSNAKTS